MNHFNASRALALITIGMSLCYAPVCAAPSDAQETASGTVPSYATGKEQIHGRIASIRDAYSLIVRDDRDFLDTVRLRRGTIINPTGSRLTTGMRVVILGRNQGPVFAADEIDMYYAYAQRNSGGRTTVILAPSLGW